MSKESNDNLLPAQARAGHEEGRLGDQGTSEFSRKKRRLVLIFSDDEAVARAYTTSLNHYGYNPVVSANFDKISSGPLSFNPEAIVVLLSPDGDEGQILVSIRRLLDENKLEAPVIFIGERDDFELRVRTVRAGCSSFLDITAPPLALVQQLDGLTARFEKPYRVLTVDDSRAQSKHIHRILKDAGMTTASITDPRKILKSLHTFRPEIIVMDLNMPEASGDEIAAVIRQEDEYTTLPIVYLSEVQDPVKQARAMISGGDDFLTKPIIPERFVSSVIHRVKRFRLLRQLVETDALTGLTNHSHTLGGLEYQFNEAQKTGQPGAWAVFDLDLFKQVNDTYGHIAGDQVIKSFARCLKEMTRKQDVAGRIGGEEFALIMPKTPVEGALSVVDWLCDSFSEIVHTCNGQSFQVSVSAGCARFESFETDLALRQATDIALYQSKSMGRNRVTQASPDMLNEPADTPVLST